MVRETFHEDSMGDNVSVKNGGGDSGSGAVPSSRESSFMRDLRRAATSPSRFEFVMVKLCKISQNSLANLQRVICILYLTKLLVNNISHA